MLLAVNRRSIAARARRPSVVCGSFPPPTLSLLSLLSPTMEYPPLPPHLLLKTHRDLCDDVSLLCVSRSWSVCCPCQPTTGASLWWRRAGTPTPTTWSSRTPTATPRPREVRGSLPRSRFAGVLIFARLMRVSFQWACWDLWPLRSTSSIKPLRPARCLSAWSPPWRPGNPAKSSYLCQAGRWPCDEWPGESWPRPLR